MVASFNLSFHNLKFTIYDHHPKRHLHSCHTMKTEKQFWFLLSSSLRHFLLFSFHQTGTGKWDSSSFNYFCRSYGINCRIQKHRKNSLFLSTMSRTQDYTSASLATYTPICLVISILYNNQFMMHQSTVYLRTFFCKNNSLTVCNG